MLRHVLPRLGEVEEVVDRTDCEQGVGSRSA